MQGQRPLSDEALLDTVQRQTLRYFWDFAHPASGLARERSNTVFTRLKIAVLAPIPSASVITAIATNPGRFINPRTA